MILYGLLVVLWFITGFSAFVWTWTRVEKFDFTTNELPCAILYGVLGCWGALILWWLSRIKISVGGILVKGKKDE